MSDGSRLLARRTAVEVQATSRTPFDGKTLAEAQVIVDAVRGGGEVALRQQCERFDELRPGVPLVLERAALVRAQEAIPAQDLALLQRVAARIERFARAQSEHLGDLELDVPGGRAGLRYLPLQRAGCYAPGGRYPLPSSVLMTAVTARVAGVPSVWVASPKPAPIMLAAAAVAGVDAFLCAGGAQAIAALAFGAGAVPRCDVIVGPGNRWVTAAKQIVSAHCAIDMLAGPSELLIVADDAADPALVAADLLAQAEHDPDAVPMLVAASEGFVGTVDRELARQLADLPTGEVARAALHNGFVVVSTDPEEIFALCDRLAPEHLHWHVQEDRLDTPLRKLRSYGALFLGSHSAEVLGDYGTGPNHVLPTGGAARHAGGLSVLAVGRQRTFLRFDDASAAAELARDAGRVADLEGLPAHAGAARRRSVP
jgi:phosphoribosyl-ATP pyrophosphohydrolase/phosphoribosyl-AMP cyclohydrolase/histidinol dehydrogenase